MRYFSNLKTSDKLTLTFSLFTLFSLVVLLFSINVSYFFIWYNQIKKESLYDMNINYNSYTDWMVENNKEAFKNYILEKDTIITPIDSDEMICSAWVTTKLHNDPNAVKEVMDSFFYEIDWKTYFVFTKNYDDIWEVSILNDTTDYFNSQVIIIKISAVIIFLFIIFNYFAWRYISRITLRELKNISNKVCSLDLNDKLPNLNVVWPEDDEIRILWEALNESFLKIQNQSETQKQFITDVSHEFKTPLMVLNSKIDLYTKAVWLWKKVSIDKLLVDVKLWIKKLNKLLETMFFISRVQDNSIKLCNEKINIKTSTNWLLSDLNILFPDKNIKLDVNINDNFLLNADRVIFNILLENIFTNAIKFNWNDVLIKVYNKWNSLFIEDNWNGIEKDKLKSIWEKFKRYDVNIEWFWVWLFIVKRIAEIYNWWIDVESTVWKWTTFTIKF